FRLAEVTFYRRSVHIKLDLPQGECFQAQFHLFNATIVSPVLRVLEGKWLPLLRLFSSVEVLEVSGGLAG
ncbi:hypothetical protein EDB89DRAFT_2231577, partial [Lactarius sanguifluus]